MKRFITLLAIPALMAGLLAPASAGPSEGGWSTDNVEYVGFVPFENATSTGVSIQGKYMYLTSWKNLSIYDIKDPENPALLSTVPFGTQGEDPFMFENEQVSTNGEVLLFAEQLPRNILFVYDVEDKTNPQLIGKLAGAGGHTTSCILDCRWTIGSAGYIVDLKNPAKPKLMKQNLWEMTKMEGGVHDVEEIKRGVILVSGYSMLQIVDVKNPLKPKVLASAANKNANFIFHSGTWPNKMKDRWVMMQGEKNFKPRCDTENSGPFQTFDTKGWQKSKTFKLVDTYAPENGTYQDGRPAVNALGCSAHWFTPHQTFKNGGLVAIGYYEHGTRFVDVASNGKIKEVGWFVPWGGSTSAAYWASKDIAYAVDYTRGIDILRYTGK
ncbi:MAG: hypothetical protein KY391_06350, partial [Actinobacteria bacterium]|nr:hypothetical protein [Actinomycetota bacterium]